MRILVCKNANQFWTEYVLPAYQEFASSPSNRYASEVSQHVWHLIEWIWNDEHRPSDLGSFRKKFIGECPQLIWIRDVAEATKHAVPDQKVRLVREMKVQMRVMRGPLNTYAFNTMALNSCQMAAVHTVVLDDGTAHVFAKALATTIKYFQEKHFEPQHA